MNFRLRPYLIALALLLRLSIFAVQTDLQSPRIQNLIQELQSGNKQSLTDFWEEASSKGTPIVENGVDAQALVTFVWFANHQNEIPIIISELVGTDNCMQNISGTNLWYRSLLASRDLRTLYGFVSDVNAVHLPFEQKYFADPFNTNHYTYPEGTYLDSQKIDFSILELQDAPKQPWVKRRENIPRGKLGSYKFTSQTLENSRDIWVYTPSNYIPHGKKKISCFDSF